LEHGEDVDYHLPLCLVRVLFDIETILGGFFKKPRRELVRLGFEPVEIGRCQWLSLADLFMLQLLLVTKIEVLFQRLGFLFSQGLLDF
jgi:hypothetical protein